MTIHLPEDLAGSIRAEVLSGRFASAETSPKPGYSPLTQAFGPSRVTGAGRCLMNELSSE